MISDFRIVTAAIGYVLVGKMVFDYFSRPPHPDARVHRLNRWRVYSVIVFFTSLAVATPAYMVGVPFIGVLIIFGIAICALLICCVCTLRVIFITGRW